ncbi:MAG: cysteine-rich small domain-containing protein [Clostridia bacterium]|nr:cysteine-rich small domain-containing protein [Clostridia bacterium]
MSNQNHYQFFQHRECEYFPCHASVAREDFNCLFCYCPLYCLGKQCGGRFFYDSKGRKVCRDCTFPHQRNSFDSIMARYRDIMTLVQQTDSAHSTEEHP